MDNKKQEILAANLTTNLLPLYNKEFPLVFFWSPKSGCTSLIKWYFFQIGLLQEAMDYNPWIHFYRVEVYEKQEYYKPKIVKQLLDGNKHVFKLIRNPYTRAVSSFLAVIQDKQLRSLVFQRDIPNGLSFKQFLYHVKNIGVTRDLIDHHIAQQYVEEEEFFIKHYIRLEDFSAEIRDIEKKYNLLKSPLLNIIKSDHHTAQNMNDKSKQVFADVKMFPGTLSKPLPHYRNFYDDETRDLVRELFEKDFEKYSYNKNDLNLT